MTHALDLPAFANMCIDRVLLPEEEDAVQLLAAKANRRNRIERTLLDPDTREAISIGFEYRKCWEPGAELHVLFMDGDTAVHEKVVQVASEWMKYANVKFVFDNSNDAQIRISFGPGGYWSWIGMEALVRPRHEQTMNLQGFQPNTPDREYNRVVLHEFGHALGAIHEHQSPRSSIPWDRNKVIAHYSGYPNYWTEKQIVFNVLDKYNESKVNASEFDPFSIMLYPVPRDLTIGGFEIPWTNTGLSEMDKHWAAVMYPFE